jgi:hypothetical protein
MNRDPACQQQNAQSLSTNHLILPTIFGSNSAIKKNLPDPMAPDSRLPNPSIAIMIAHNPQSQNCTVDATHTKQTFFVDDPPLNVTQAY